MKKLSTFTSIVVLCCFIFNSTLIFAQKESGKNILSTAKELKPLNVEIFKQNILSRDFSNLLKSDEEIIKINTHLTKIGYVPQTNAKNFWGVRETYKDNDKELVYTVRIQDYAKRNSKNNAAIGQVTVTTGNRSVTYSFFLEAPAGDFNRAVEYTVDERLKIIKVNSWWSCVKNYLKNRCIAVCISSLVGCSGSWAAYIGCVAAACGGCFTLGSICCACNCKWWCKWAAGCCKK